MTVPFFVADRPMSLRLLSYCEIDKQKGIYGLMGHANTTKNFQSLFRDFHGDNIIKAVDSGVFTRNGCNISYHNLFDIYDRMDAQYGIMIDILKDKKKTIKSAKKAMRIYNKKKHSFKLVGVAQGKSIIDYIECYEELKKIGFKHIAIGGLLKKTVNSARWVRIKNEGFVKEVMKTIRKKYPHDWIFLLGCYNPKRHEVFNKYNLFGGDYKGWIFNYKTPEQWIEILTNEINTLKEIKNHRKEIKEKEFLIQKFKTMNTSQKREYRFKQVKAYLNKNVFSFYKNRLLVIGCSNRKKEVMSLAPAIDMYDGPMFRIIRKMINKQQFPNDVHVMILSAKYGIMGMYDMIQNYDLKITDIKTHEMRQDVSRNVEKFLICKQFIEGFINLGETYQDAFEVTFNFPLQFAQGKIGERQSQTKNWITSSRKT